MKKHRFVIVSLIFLLLGFGLITSCSNLLESLENVTIEYKTDYGELPNQKTIAFDSELTESELPTLSDDNYIFLGWYKDGIKIDVGYKITSNTVLSAQWEQKKATDVTIGDDNTLVDYGDRISLICKDIENVNIYYTLDGTLPTVESKLYNPETGIIIKDNCTIKAFCVKNGYLPSNISEKEYTLKKYEIKYKDIQDGEGLFRDKLDNLNKGYELSTYDLPELRKKDFIFKGWFIEGVKDAIKPGYKVIKNLELVARWEIDESTVIHKVGNIIFSEPFVIDNKDTITLECRTDNAEIHYSINNSVVNETSPIYTKPIELSADEDLYVYAKAYRKDYIPSDLQTAHYTIKKHLISFNNGGHGTVYKDSLNLKKYDRVPAEYFNISAPNSGFEFDRWVDHQGNTAGAGYEVLQPTKITAIWKDINPIPVVNLRYEEDIGKVKVLWDKKEIEEDLNKIILSYNYEGSNSKDTVINLSKTSTSYIIDNVKLDQKYSVKVTVVDNGNNQSTPNTMQFTMQTKGMEILPDEKPTDPTDPTKPAIKYVEFGMWPSLVGGAKPKLKSEELVNYRGWECYLGVDGTYYIKRRNKFNEEMYHKLNPIKWHVSQIEYKGQTTGGKSVVLVAENIVDNCPYYADDKTYDVYGKYSEVDPGLEISYSDSQIRAFLNGFEYKDYKQVMNQQYLNKGFYQKAFTNAEQKLIHKRIVQNSNIQQDPVFLLSLEETKTYFFDGKELSEEYLKKSGPWWFRTEYAELYAGCANSKAYNPYRPYGPIGTWCNYGVVPAIIIDYFN